MNVIKEFYIDQFKQQMPAVEQAFHWRFQTMPKGERIGSVTFMIASLNAFIGSLCLAGAVFIGTEQPLSGPGAFILGFVVFAIALTLHILYYRKSLSKKSDAEVIRKQEENLESALEKKTE